MQKSLTKEELALNQHVEDLRERMRLLQGDRKANVDVLEANKSANKEEIKRLRDENKELRQKLALLQRTSAKDEENNSRGRQSSAGSNCDGKQPDGRHSGKVEKQTHTHIASKR